MTDSGNPRRQSIIRAKLKGVLPRWVISPVQATLKKRRRARRTRRRLSRPLLSEDAFRRILIEDLGLNTGETVMVHGAMGELHLDFPFENILDMLKETVGEKGTLIFPTYPEKTSHEYLIQGDIFDVSTTPSGMGLLSEYARSRPEAIRSLHPTKSVCALGHRAAEITATHHLSLNPYDLQSPYQKMMKYGAKVIGLGIFIHQGLSHLHTVEGARDLVFPANIYDEHVFRATCRDSQGHPRIVETRVHRLDRMRFRIPEFLRDHIPSAICRNLVSHGHPFFWADADKLFHRMMDLARQGITMYR